MQIRFAHVQAMRLPRLRLFQGMRCQAWIKLKSAWERLPERGKVPAGPAVLVQGVVGTKCRDTITLSTGGGVFLQKSKNT